MENECCSPAAISLTFAEYCKILRFAKYPPGVLYPFMSISVEGNEALDKITKAFRDKRDQWDGYKYHPTDADRIALEKELGDVLWNVAAAAREIGSSLEEVAIANMKKLELRASTGTIQGSGDNREQAKN